MQMLTFFVRNIIIQAECYSLMQKVTLLTRNHNFIKAYSKLSPRHKYYTTLHCITCKYKKSQTYV